VNISFNLGATGAMAALFHIFGKTFQNAHWIGICFLKRYRQIQDARRPWKI